MARHLTIRRLGLIAATTAMAGAIHTGAQAEQQIDCNSGLTQIAIASEQGSEEGIPLLYAHCVPPALRPSSSFRTTETAERAGVAGSVRVVGRNGNGMEQEKPSHAWPDQDFRD